MTDLRLGQVLFLSGFKTQLDGVVAVLLGGLLLHHGAGSSLNQGDGHHTAGRIEDLGHADLFADDRFLHLHWIFLLLRLLVDVVGFPLGWDHCSGDLTRPPQNAADCGTNKVVGLR